MCEVPALTIDCMTGEKGSRNHFKAVVGGEKEGDTWCRSCRRACAWAACLHGCYLFIYSSCICQVLVFASLYHCLQTWDLKL